MTLILQLLANLSDEELDSIDEEKFIDTIPILETE